MISPENSAPWQGRIYRTVLWMAVKQIIIWKTGKEVEWKTRQNKTAIYVPRYTGNSVSKKLI